MPKIAKPASAAIGSVPCPYADCPHESIPVFKIAARPGAKVPARNLGKLYARCPDHGLIGQDGKQAAIDYITERLSWSSLPKENPDSVPTATPSEPPPAPPAPAAPRRPWWAPDLSSL